MEYIEGNDLAANAEAMGERFESRLIDHPAVKEIRRSGLLMAVELGTSEKLFAVMENFTKNGIMSDWFLFCDTAFRISPPLVISDDEVDEVCVLIEQVLNKL